jgi:tetratricopeptide (TPR) repeat protein
MSPDMLSSGALVMHSRHAPRVGGAPLPGRRRPAFLAAFWLAAACGSGLAADVVILEDGSRLQGAVVSLAPDAIEIEDRSGVKKFGIDQVRELVFDGEPESLTTARGLLLRRDMRGASDELAKLEQAEIQEADPRVREEYEFLQAAVAARADGATAAQPLTGFLTRHPRSHHFFAAHEMLGDLYARLGKFTEAAAAFGELDRGPPLMRIRSAAKKAGLLIQQDKPAEAIREFEAAVTISTANEDLASASEKGEARLGIARCLALTGKAADGVQVVRATIRGADPRDRDLLAAAFATLGQCQRAIDGREEDAMISFLTVELVYDTVPERHAEALFHLVELWEKLKRPERARDARRALLTLHPESPWTKKLDAAADAS